MHMLHEAKANAVNDHMIEEEKSLRAPSGQV